MASTRPRAEAATKAGVRVATASGWTRTSGPRGAWAGRRRLRTPSALPAVGQDWRAVSTDLGSVADEGGFTVLRAVELGAGHVIVFGDEWISFDSEWTGHPDYQVERFWLNALKWMSPPTECQVPILI